MILLTIFILIQFAGLIYAAEAAVVNFNQDDYPDDKKDDSVIDIIEELQKKLDDVHSTVILSSTFLLITSSLLTLIYVDTLSVFGGVYEGVLQIIFGAVVLMVVYIILGFLIPKSIGIKLAPKLAPILARFLSGVVTVSLPFSKLLLKISNILLKPFNVESSYTSFHLSEDELKALLDEGVKAGTLEETEHEFIQNVLEFHDLRANEVMIPRIEMAALELTDNYEENIKNILRIRHSFIPVYEDSLDNIIGILHVKDLLSFLYDKKEIDIKKLLRPAYFVPETKPISEILTEMQQRIERIAIVADEYGGTEGMITLDDILSEIVGEISSENYNQEESFQRLDDNTYLILGSMEISEFNDLFNVELPENEDYSTIAGFISYHTGKILNTGEKFFYENFQFELFKKQKQRMVQFKVLRQKESVE